MAQNETAPAKHSASEEPPPKRRNHTLPRLPFIPGTSLVRDSLEGVLQKSPSHKRWPVYHGLPD